MRTKVWGGIAVAGVLSLTACGSNGESQVVEASTGAGDGVGAGVSDDPAAAPTDPETPVSSGTMPAGEPDEAPKPDVVKPRPGMANVHPINWDSSALNSPSSVRITFYGGVAPCHVLDSVKVSYKAKKIAVTLYSGSDPAKPDTACIEIAKLMAVDVKLTEDVGDRQIVDGAPGAVTPMQEPAPDPAASEPQGKMSAPPADGSGAKLVTPRPGTADKREQSWDSAKATGDRTVRVLFMSGVEPCSVLDSYKVAYTADKVVITLYSGRDAKASADTACIMLAQQKAVDVTLTEDLGDREIVDGSAQ